VVKNYRRIHVVTVLGSIARIVERCADGHEWEAQPSDVKGGHWCPECTIHVSERICREMFERIFDKKFPKRKPKWLLNPDTGKKMELDGFCKELNLAFEYQGQHHYKETGFTTEELVMKQKSEIN
jgi:hypothetical protein